MLTILLSSNYFGRTRDIFALHIMGKKIYIITDPADVTTAFNNREGLSFDGHLGRLLKNFGVRPEALNRAWHKPQPGDWCHIPNNPINPKHLDLIHFVEETMKKQLGFGEHEEKQCRDFLASASTSLQFGADGLLDYCTLSSSNSCFWCSDCTSGEGGQVRRDCHVEKRFRSFPYCHWQMQTQIAVAVAQPAELMPLLML